LPVQFTTGSTFRLAISDILILLYLVAVSFRLRRLDGAWSSWYSALMLVMGMGLAVAVTHTGEITFYALFQKALGLVIMLITAACVMDHARNAQRIRRLLSAFVLGVLANVVVGVAALTVQLGNPAALPMINEGGVRLAGLTVDPNAFGGLVAAALMVHLLTARTAMEVVPKRWRHLVTVVLSVALVMTFSRSAWIGTLCGFVVTAAVSRRVALRSLGGMVATLVVAVPILAGLVFPDLVGLVARPEQIGSRAAIIADSLSDLANSPVVGTGLGTYVVRHGVIIHNTAIWMATEMGVPGLLVFVGLVLSTLVRLSRCARFGPLDLRQLALGLLAMHAVMIGLSVGIEALYQRSWWLVFALAGNICALSRRPL
jgi:hypothetical protein